MDKNTNNKSNHNNDGMLKEKTNQDYNKQKPDPNNPNQKTQYLEGEEEEKENKERAFKTKSGDLSKDAQRRDDINREAKKKNEEATTSDRTQNGNRNHNGEGKQNDNKFEKQESKKGRL